MILNKSFVVVSGLPASGKSTIGRALADHLKWQVIDKDVFLEDLFRSSDQTETRRALSRRSDERFRQAALAASEAVLISFWHVRGMPHDSGTSTEWLTILGHRLVHVHCACPAPIAAERFRLRKRHPGHEDHQRSLEELADAFRRLDALGPPRFSPPIVVNSTSPVDIAALAAQVRARTIEA